jgi:hypothetical protein
MYKLDDGSEHDLAEVWVEPTSQLNKYLEEKLNTQDITFKCICIETEQEVNHLSQHIEQNNEYR